MADISKNSLQFLPENIRNSTLVDTEAIHVVVLAVQRYLIDPAYSRQSGINDSTETEAYDLTLTDLTHKVKCLLNPRHNHSVRRRQLCPGCVLRISPKDCVLRFNDLNLDSEAFIILQALEVVDNYQGDVGEVDFCSYCSDHEKGDIPLVTNRGNYLPLWNTDSPEPSCWKCSALQKSSAAVGCRVFVADLATKWKRMSKPYGALVVRVLNMSRLRFFGKTHKSQKWPYQISLEVADNTGVCTVTVWGALCPDLLYSVEVGSILKLETYSVRERFSLSNRPTSRNPNLTAHNIEIGLDKRNPASTVTVLDGLQDRGVPRLQAEFFNRQQIRSLPDKYNCDVAGVVLRVGRYQRIRKGPDGHEFWMFRWLHLVDDSSKQPLFLQLFSTSQQTAQSAIIPGSVLVVTQVRVVHSLENVTHSRQPRPLYVTTTNESRVFLCESDTDPWAETDFLKNLNTWGKSSICKAMLQTMASVCGGLCYAALPHSLAQYRSTYEPDRPLELTGEEAVQSKLSGMSFREAVRFNIQGFLLHVEYHRASPSPSQATTTTTTRKLKNSNSRKTVSLRSGRVVRGDTSPYKTTRPYTKRQQTEVSQDCPSQVVLSLLHPQLTDRLRRDGAVVGETTSHPSTLARVYHTDSDQQALMAAHVLMPAYKHIQLDSLPLEAVASRSPGDYLTITATGLNHQVVFFTHFLLPPHLPPDVSLTQVLAGSVSWDWSEILSQPDGQRSAAIKNLLASSTDLCDKRLLLVLDGYCHGNRDELLINRAYVITK